MYAIMYHRILGEDLQRSSWAGIAVEEFVKQIDTISEEHGIINEFDFEKKYANECVLLTFDDGYREHYSVAKRLANRGYRALFFVSGNIFHKKILPVHMIQYILSISDEDTILSGIIEQLNFYSKRNIVYELHVIIANILKEDTWDTKKTLIIKRLLQRDLPKKIREKICTNLFNCLSSKTYDEVFHEMYLSLTELQKMKEMGMIIGNHTEEHLFLSRLSYNEQLVQIKSTTELLLRHRLIDDQKWVFSYPYGDYDFETMKILSNLGCYGAFTTTKGKIYRNNRYTLPRYDCKLI